MASRVFMTATSARSPHQTEVGLALPITLVMLAMAMVLSVFALKSSLFEELIAGNRRGIELARQAAETALRICEAAVQSDNPTALGFNAFDIQRYATDPGQPNAALAMEAPSRWSSLPSGVLPNTLDQAFIDHVVSTTPSTDPSRAYFVGLQHQLHWLFPGPPAAYPQCLIMRLRFPSGSGSGDLNIAYRITVRGVGNVANAVVSLQSEVAVIWN